MALPLLLIPMVAELVKELTKDEPDESKTKIKESIAYEVSSAAMAEVTKDTRKFWQSKRWYMTAVALLVPVLNRSFGWELSETEILAIAGPVVAYVLGKSWEQKR